MKIDEVLEARGGMELDAPLLSADGPPAAADPALPPIARREAIKLGLFNLSVLAAGVSLPYQKPAIAGTNGLSALSTPSCTVNFSTPATITTACGLSNYTFNCHLVYSYTGTAITISAYSVTGSYVSGPNLGAISIQIVGLLTGPVTGSTYTVSGQVRYTDPLNPGGVLMSATGAGSLGTCATGRLSLNASGSGATVCGLSTMTTQSP